MKFFFPACWENLLASNSIYARIVTLIKNLIIQMSYNSHFDFMVPLEYILKGLNFLSLINNHICFSIQF